jgi:hypothetical protein
VNPRYPDFTNKVGGQGLWLWSAPKWVLSELEGLKFDVQTQKSKQVKQQKGEHGKYFVFSIPQLCIGTAMRRWVSPSLSQPCLDGTPISLPAPYPSWTAVHFFLNT